MRMLGVLVVLGVLVCRTAGQNVTDPQEDVQLNGHSLQPAVLLTLDVLAGLQIGFGAFLLLLGFRLWKISSFAIGFFFALFFMFFLLLYVLDGNSNAFAIAIGSGIGTGLVVGLLMFCVPILALVFAAFATGAAFGIMFYDIVLVYIRWPYMYWVSLGAFAVVFLILAVCIKKSFIVAMTSFYGAFGICYGVGFFTGGLPVFVDPAVRSVALSERLWLGYVYLVAIIAGTILGCLLQFLVTARGLRWEDVQKSICPRKKRSSKRKEKQRLLGDDNDRL